MNLFDDKTFAQLCTGGGSSGVPGHHDSGFIRYPYPLYRTDSPGCTRTTEEKLKPNQVRKF